MSTISAQNAALTILSQSVPTVDQNANAADQILDIVSGRKATSTKAADDIAALAATTKTAVADAPREVGGNISTEISPAWKSATAAAATHTLNSSEVTSGDPWEADVTDAMNRAIVTIGRAIVINLKFNLLEEVDLDSRLTDIETERQNSISTGTSEESANARADALKRSAASVAISNKMTNENLVRMSNTTAMIYNDILQQAGVANTISLDSEGRASVSAFDITDSSGRKLLSLGDDGALTIYNADGSVKNTMNREEVALATTNTTNTFGLKRSGVDLKQTNLY